MTVKAWIVVTAAGSGSRLGSGVPKALVEVDGQTILELALRRIAASDLVQGIVITCTPGYQDEFEAATSQILGTRIPWKVVPGGTSRQASVYRALQAIAMSSDTRYATDDLSAESIESSAAYSVSTGLSRLSPEINIDEGSPVSGLDEITPVLVHDAARCLAPTGLFDSVIDAIQSGASAVIPVLPVVDTIKIIDPATGVVQGTPDRAMLRSVQTPQGFQWGPLYQAHVAEAARGASESEAVTDDAGLLEARGIQVQTVAGDPLAFKVTLPEDLALLERTLEQT